MAKDGNVITRPRYQIIPLKDTEEKLFKFAESLPGGWKGQIERVIEDVGKGKVRVVFKLPDGGEYVDVIPKSYLK
jgi:hypothetical protein